MLIRSLLGLAALLVATSCVPSRIAAPTRRAPAAITASDATLLRRLALAPPEAPDDSGHALPVAAAPLAAFAVTPLTAAPPFAGGGSSIGDAGRAVDCLTAAVYYEARSEPEGGQRAVAQVVLNRVRDRAFPGSVCGVVYQRSSKGCQFSFACDGSTMHAIDPSAWERARTVAAAAFGGAVYAPVGAATYYHTTAVSPWWAPSLARIGQIGAHIFYGWRRAMADALSFRRGYAGIEPGSAAPALVLAGHDDIPTVAGVTIHRGETAPPPGDAAGIVMIAGVRIHRRPGTSSDRHAGPSASGAASAEIGPESDERPGDLDPI